MGLLTSALQIGRSAILSYQSALQVVGNNISNAGSPDYTRQTPGLTPMNSARLPEGMRPGAGVALTSVKRNLDEALENRLRTAMGTDQLLQARRTATGAVETLFDPLIGAQLPRRLADFFNSLSDVQNSPADPATRDLAVAAGATLAGTLRQLRHDLGSLAESINDQIGALVTQANDLSSQIADMNTEIVSVEASGSPASALRDQRDALLRQLSEIIGVTVRVQPDGALNVYVGNEAMVQGGISRGLTVMSTFDGEFRRDAVAFADNNARITNHSGQLQGLIAARDDAALGQITDLDRLATSIIFEVNKVHSDGQGLTGFRAITANRSVLDTASALDSAEAGLDFTPINGSFYIAVTDDATGTTTSFQVQVDLDGIDDDTTLESLVADINATVKGVTADISPDNRLVLTAAEGTGFTFGHDGSSQRTDTSHILAALGINTFFDGSSAANITVNSDLVQDPTLLAAAGVNLSGDGVNAGRLTVLGESQIEMLNGISIMQFHNTMAGAVATAAKTANDDVESSATVVAALQAQKENISGVSLDEEAIELVKFERAFQGAARFVAVVDRLIAEMISIVR